MKIVAGFAELFAWVFLSIALCSILFGLGTMIGEGIHRARYQHRRRQQRAHDPYDISEEEFEAAKAHFIAKHGSIPPSLQRIADRGGRFGLPRKHEEASERLYIRIESDRLLSQVFEDQP